MKLATQVGDPVDAEAIRRDVRELWSLGRFEDIRVETAPHGGGTAVMFRVVPSPVLRLHDVRIEPASYALKVKPPEGTPLNPMRAHEIAAQARAQLESHGYVNPQVDWEFVPFAKGLADLKLTVRATDPVRVRQVNFSGNTALDESGLRHQLQALHTRRILFWKLAPSYSEGAVQADLARITSAYLAKGYFDVQIRADEPEFHAGKANLTIAIDAGAHYEVRNPIDCASLLAKRREAQHDGVLDFAVRAELQGDELKTFIDRGAAYRVRRISFSGNRHFSDTTIRRNFALDEAEPFDEYKLRKSLARLNRTSFFEPVDVKDVAISPREANGEVDVNVRLRERKRGKWAFSGPVGPPSIGGPLQLSINSRVPWLSSFAVGITVVALHPPLYGIIPVKSFIPIAVLQRPFDPGSGWLSGFAVAPQLGWSYTAITYTATQLKERLTPILEGDHGLTTELPVTMETRSGEKTMICEPPNPRFWVARHSLVLGLHLLAAIPSL